MKKVLLASTVLAMTASVAAAEVTVKGTARMGVAYNDALVNEFAFTSRARVEFVLSGETDSGLTFGASFQAHDAGAANAGTAGSVFVSGAFGKLSMGDVSGAAEFVVGDLAGVGLTGIGDYNENVYLSNIRRSAARYEYSTGGLTFAVSADNPGSNGALVAYSFYGGNVLPPAAITEDTFALGVKYAVDAYSVSLGYESSNIAGVTVDHVIAGAEATFSGVTVKATYGQADLGAADFKQYGVSASYKADALTLKAFYRAEDISTLAANWKAYGIGAEYDLGGGATIAGGISENKVSGAAGQTRADFGIKFAF